MQNLFKLTPFKIGLINVILVCFLAPWDPEILQVLELKLLDQRFQSRGTKQPGPEVVIAVIDEKSQDALGRWPWSRATLARLVDKLNDAGAITIGFDMVFSESGDAARDTAMKLIEHTSIANTPEGSTLLGEIKKIPSEDELFAESIRRGENVILGYFFHDSIEDVLHLSSREIRQGLDLIAPSRYQSVEIQKGARVDILFSAVAVESNLPIFAKAAAGMGHFNLAPDLDGIMRRYPLVIKAGNKYFPPLVLRVIAHYLEEEELHLTLGPYGVVSVRAGNVEIPVDSRGQFLIDYYGEQKLFPHIPIVDILEDKVKPGFLEDRIVLIGATGKGIFDLRATPFEGVYPGVEINATMIDNVLQNNYLQKPKGYWTYNYLLILFLGLVLSYLLSRVKAVTGFLVTLLVFILYYYVNQELFNRGIWINLIYPFLQILAVYISITVYNYFTETKQKQFINNAFGQYLSPAVVKRLVNNPSLLELGGELKRMTAFFSDVASFSTISEKLTPVQLVELLNEYLTEMTDIVLKYEGTIDKYEGDAIIAFFGAPLDLPDHAARACLASIEMQNKLVEMRKDWTSRGKDPLNVRIGLNTGSMVVGNMGSHFRMDYTMMGDSVNLASRLEGVNKVYGTVTMISQFTYEDVKDLVEVRELDKIRVVGKLEPVTIYELLAKKGELEGVITEILPVFYEGLAHYRNQNWEEGIACFEKVLEIDEDDGPSLTYFERCITFQDNPPPKNWDGVFSMKTK